MGIFIGPRSSLGYWRSHPDCIPGWRRLETAIELPATVSDWGGVTGFLKRVESDRRLRSILGHGRIDILVGSREARSANKRLDYSIVPGVLPAGSFFRIADGIYICSPELCVILATRELDGIAAIQLMYETVGGYSVCGSDKGFIQRPPLTTIERIRSLLEGMIGFSRRRWLLELTGFVLDGSMSPMETACAMTLILPRRFGGYGLKKLPELNREIEVEGRARQVISKGLLRADMCWLDEKLIVEYDSTAEHENAPSIDADNNRRVALQFMGFKVVTITRKRFASAGEFDKVFLPISKELGLRLRETAPSTLRKREELLRRLRRPVGWSLRVGSRGFRADGLAQAV